MAGVTVQLENSLRAYPPFSVVVPESGLIKVPLGYPVSRRHEAFAARVTGRRGHSHSILRSSRPRAPVLATKHRVLPNSIASPRARAP